MVNKKLSARERINMLFDANSFIEINVHVRHRCTDFGMEEKYTDGDGVIVGYGMIDGRTVCAFTQDYTVMGGAMGEMNASKIAEIQKKALSMGVPIVGLFDSGGARVQEGIQGLSGHGHIFLNNVKSSGKIPQISAIMGNCAGGAAYSPALTDFIIMIDKTSNMFITGPKVVKAAIGEEVGMEELGGTEVHATVSGLADFVSKDEKTCIENIKHLLRFLPDNYYTMPNRNEKYTFSSKKSNQIQHIIPDNNRRAFDVRKVIECIADDESTLEIKPRYATNIVTALARISGYPVGFVANQSLSNAGSIDIDAADKAARFIRTCDNNNIPIISLVDVPGFFPGKEQEQKGIVRHGAKMLFAFGESRVLKITIIIRRAYGGAYLAMGSKEMGADYVYAWPGSEMAVMGAEAATDVLMHREQENEKKEAFLKEYKEKFLNSNKALHMGYVDEVIEPERTREIIQKNLENSWGRWKCGKEYFHRNIPL